MTHDDNVVPLPVASVTRHTAAAIADCLAADGDKGGATPPIPVTPGVTLHSVTRFGDVTAAFVTLAAYGLATGLEGLSFTCGSAGLAALFPGAPGVATAIGASLAGTKLIGAGLTAH